MLNHLSGVHLSDERLRYVTNQQGRVQAKLQHEEAKQLLQEAVHMQKIREQREQRSSLGKPQPPEWLQVGLDGGWIPSREQKGGMEGKIGVIASQLDPVGKQGRHRLTK